MPDKYLKVNGNHFEEVPGTQTGTGVPNAGQIPALNSNGVVDLTLLAQANTSQGGYVGSTDWNNFNNKASKSFAVAMAIALG